MKNKKLLQLNVTANWGSTGRIAEGIGKAALKRGWESHVAYGRYMNKTSSKLYKTGSQLDACLHYVRSKVLDKEGLGSVKATKELIGYIMHIKPDIIQLHNIHDHWLNYPLLFEFLKRSEIPVVWTLHDCWSFTGSCFYFEEENCSGWQGGCKNCSLRKGINRARPNFLLKERLFRNIKDRCVIVGVSNWLIRLLPDSIFHDFSSVTIHNGVDTDMFKPCSHKANRPTIIGVASHWEERKGLRDLIGLREKFNFKELDIVIVGLSLRQIRNLPGNIKGIGRIQDASALARLYSEANALVNPTYVDTFPTVNIEALSCGTPVVTYDTGGSSEAIDSLTGIVVPKGDSGGLAVTVGKMIENPSMFSPHDCRNRVLARFNQDIQFDRYIDLYESILS